MTERKVPVGLLTSLGVFVVCAALLVGSFALLSGFRRDAADKALCETALDVGRGDELAAISMPEDTPETVETPLDLWICRKNGQNLSYVAVYPVDAGSCGVFHVAVGVDILSETVTGVACVPMTLAAQNGTDVLWEQGTLFDPFVGKNAREIAVLTAPEVGRQAFEAVLDRTLDALEAAAWLKESEEHL